MAEASSTVLDPLDHVEWMWKANPNPWSKTEPAEWKHYSDVENLIIEEAFSNGEPKAIFDRYYIDFTYKVQTLTTDKNKQRPVKRMLCKREDKHLREERFMENPVTSKQGMGDEYGWMSPFIVEVRRSLGLKIKQLPSKDESLVPMLVEKAANGIIEEGKQLGKAIEAEMMVKLLREKTNQGFKEVWKCCVYLYSMETFLYKKMNEIMRLVGSEEHDQIWRNKVHTLGPFCLLLWDDPINEKLKSDMTIYRGVKLAPDQIAMYEDLANYRGEYHSWQAFTSCTRNRTKAEKFGNALFVIKVDLAFVADISSLSHYPKEEEELIAPGVCFCVNSVVYDAATKKHVITLQLRQRWSILQPKTTTTTTTTTTATTTSTTSATTTTTTTTETTTSTTTTACSACGNLCWNQTGAAVAGTASNPVTSGPNCINFDANDTTYICAHNMGDVQKWDPNTSTRSAITSNYGDHIDYVIFDKDGYMYSNAHDKNLIRRYPPSSGTIIVGAGSSISGTLKHPAGMAIDDNLTLYIADQDNNQIVKWDRNGTSIVQVIDTASVMTYPSALLISPTSPDQLYISDEKGTAVYLWTIGAATPTLTFTNVTDGTTLKKPRGIKLDPYGNLYVADKENERIIIFCANSTLGTIAVASTPGKTVDIAFDSNLNLYAITDTGVIAKYSLL